MGKDPNQEHKPEYFCPECGAVLYCGWQMKPSVDWWCEECDKKFNDIHDELVEVDVIEDEDIEIDYEINWEE